MSHTVLITGASSGIGKATAKHFHANGWNVIATMRSPEKEQELNTLDRMLVTRLDVQDGASITDAVNEGIARFSKIDDLLTKGRPSADRYRKAGSQNGPDVGNAPAERGEPAVGASCRT